MRETDPEAYKEYLDEQESLLDFSAWSAKNQAHHLNLDQCLKGWILTIILLRQWNWRK
jgi:hypothetical protein